MTTPYAYQEKGIRRIEHFGGCALLADEQGLGKSLQALYWRQRHLGDHPTVVICPASLKWNWQREIRTHLNQHSEVLESRSCPSVRHESPQNGIYIINYDILGAEDSKDWSWVQWLLAMRPRLKLMIVDECQALMNPDTKRSKACKELAKIIPHRIFLSGTPAVNRPIELWTSLNMIDPDHYASRWSYAMAYCEPKKSFGQWEYKGAKNLDRLHDELVSTCMIRRTKEEVLTDLPPMSRHLQLLTIDKEKEYRKAVTDFLTWMVGVDWQKANAAAQAEKLAWWTRIRELTGQLKLPAVIEWIQNFLDTSGEKLIVFGVHRAFLKVLHEKFKGISVLVNGSVVGIKRQQSFDQFNADKRIRLLFGNILAAGTGWSCKSTDNVAKAEFSWRPGDHSQAEKRVEGIERGTGKGAKVWYLAGKGTVDERMCEILERKQNTLDQMLDGKLREESLDVQTLLEAALIRDFGLEGS